MRLGRFMLVVMLAVLAGDGWCKYATAGSQSASSDNYGRSYPIEQLHQRFLFLDVLMDNPYGMQRPPQAPAPVPECKALNETCQTRTECCNQAGGVDCQSGSGSDKQCCLDIDASCSTNGTDAQCCSGFCSGTKCCLGIDASCSTNGTDAQCCSGLCSGTKCCLGFGAKCENFASTSQCCSGVCNGTCFLKIGAQCTWDAECCSSVCSGGPNNGTCIMAGRQGAPVKPAATQVRVWNPDSRGSTVVAVKDVRYGQYVQCLKATGDLRVPTTLDWCVVEKAGPVTPHEGAHAQLMKQANVHINFTSGGQGSLTVSSADVVFTLITAAEGDEADSMDKFGAYSLIEAEAIQPGDRIAVLKDKANPTAGFKVAVVKSTGKAKIKAGDFYHFELRGEYVIIDDVVMP